MIAGVDLRKAARSGMHRGRLDEDCYVDGKLIGPAAKVGKHLEAYDSRYWS